ncbi:MAG: HAD family hydrolase [Clostridia bacterium]|nr:HAD family hydrolase [Clostridia bacterium]
MQKKNNILFDLDGTLTDPMLGITKSVRYALNAFGISVDSLESLTPFIGPPLAGSFREFYGFSEEEANRALQIYREYFSQTGLFENEVYPGIPQLLSNLQKSGRHIFVATSKPTVYATQILEHFGLSDFITYIGGSELSGERVEKEDVIDFVLKNNNINKETAVMIGDRKFDIIGGKKRGLKTIGVLYGYGDEEEMTAAAPDRIAATVDDLARILL